MATTRHHINRERRRQAREARPPAPASGPVTGPGGPADEALPAAATPGPPRSGLAVLPERATAPALPRGSAPVEATNPDGTDGADRADTANRTEGGDRAGAADGGARAGTDAAVLADGAGTADTANSARAAGGRGRIRRPSRRVGLALLCALTLALGGFAGWAHARAETLRDDPALRNTALSDPARTSEIKGQTAKAVAALFSYDHADPAAYEKATKDLLTGKAVAQHEALLAGVRARADQQKAVITTSVTDSAVERIDGDRARVLVYADQSSVSTAGGNGAADTKDKQAADGGSYAGAMLAVDVVRRDGRWLVSGIDTFGR
ncbi:hypothetical protein [Streptomyces sp. NPDC102462]|uniref:hypothetical protein n=1 Tax=Streptomyces sp. NPDC102462 TaxID=3366178 RepID=UPI0038066AF6